MKLEEILTYLKNGEVTIEQATELIKYKPLDDVLDSVVDYSGGSKTGCPKAIYCEGKTVTQIKDIALSMKENGIKTILATKANAKMFEVIKNIYEEAVYSEIAKLVYVKGEISGNTRGKVLVISAGASDIPISEEAALTAEFLGNEVVRMYDIDDVYRLLSKLSVINSSTIIIVVAGMQGALASFVSGLTDKPVIGVPTSTGYGANFGGIAALLAMLNSPYVSVVNIDNGFGAGVLANKINRF